MKKRTRKQLRAFFHKLKPEMKAERKYGVYSGKKRAGVV